MLVFSSNNDSCFCFLFTGTLRGVANIHSMTPKVAAVSREQFVVYLSFYRFCKTSRMRSRDRLAKPSDFVTMSKFCTMYDRQISRSRYE